MFLIMYNEMILTTRDEKFGRNLIQSDCMILVYIINNLFFLF